MNNAQSQLLAILVMDLGYTNQPIHGHAPIRHQMAWRLAVEGRSTEDVDADIARMVGQDKFERSGWRGDDGWISVGHRLPAEKTSVLTYVDMQDGNPFMAKNDLWHGRWASYDMSVTHWRPLPAPPDAALTRREAKPRENAGVVCDMENGPCACGAWHGTLAKDDPSPPLASDGKAGEVGR